MAIHSRCCCDKPETGGIRGGGQLLTPEQSHSAGEKLTDGAWVIKHGATFCQLTDTKRKNRCWNCERMRKSRTPLVMYVKFHI